MQNNGINSFKISQSHCRSYLLAVSLAATGECANEEKPLECSEFSSQLQLEIM